MNHGDLEHRFAAISEDFIIFRMTTVIQKPSEGSFNHPTAFDDMKAFALSFDDVELHAMGFFQTVYPGGQLSTDIGAVGPEPTQASNARGKIVQQQLSEALAIPHVGSGHHDRQDQSAP